MPAVITAAAILAWQLSAALISLVVGAATYQGGLQTFLLGVSPIFLSSVPFALGVLCALGLIAPLSRELRLSSVLVRATIAAACGVVLAKIVAILLAFLGSLSTSGLLFGNSFPFPTFNGGNFAIDATSTLGNLIPYFLGELPLVVLASVFLWLWLRSGARESSRSGGSHGGV